MEPKIKIFLIHGLHANKRRAFSMILLQKYLNYHNFQSKIIIYPSEELSVRESVDYVSNEIHRYAHIESDEIILIGQSLGGVIAHELSLLGEWKVRFSIYIGSPLNGAHLVSRLEEGLPEIISDYLRSPPLEFLRDRSKRESKVIPPTHDYRTISMGWAWSNFDRCVYRNEATIEEKKHVHLSWADHGTIFFNPRLWILVKNMLNEHVNFFV